MTDYRDGHIGTFTAKPNALIIKTTETRIETIRSDTEKLFTSYRWVRADDDFVYLYFGCEVFEEDAPGSVCLIIAVKDVELNRVIVEGVD